MKINVHIRDEMFVIHCGDGNQPIEWLGPEGPNQLPPIRIHTANHPVVGAKVDAVIVKRGRNSHRPIGVVYPARLTGQGIKASN